MKEVTEGNSIYPEKGIYVLVRSRNEGINCGYVVAAESSGILLKEARRLYYHRPADASESWYEGVTNHGVSPDSKLSPVVAEKGIIEDYSWLRCTEKAQKSIQEQKAHAQS